jgi:hypothetical protein
MKHYHFDLKLKPESVPQWNGNPDVLARWISKVNCLTMPPCQSTQAWMVLPWL